MIREGDRVRTTTDVASRLRLKKLYAAIALFAGALATCSAAGAPILSCDAIQITKHITLASNRFRFERLRARNKD